MKLGIIGFGGIGNALLNIINQSTDKKYDTLSVLVRAGRGDTTQQQLQKYTPMADTITVCESLDDFMAQGLDLVVECAGQQAVHDCLPTVLNGGSDVIVTSVGALADNGLYTQMQHIARTRSCRIIIPSGAIGGIDTLAAAKLSGIEQVIYTGRKPPTAWRATPAESSIDLASISQPTVIFDGNARDVSALYPKNANVCATLALAGIGFDKTRVTLMADPTVSTNTHQYQVVSNGVNYTMDLTAVPSPDNPKTSASTAYSIARDIINYNGTVIV